MHDELHTTGLVEEALDHETLASRKRAQDRERRRKVSNHLLGGLAVDLSSTHQPCASTGWISGSKPSLHLATNSADLFAQLNGAAGGLTEPDGNRGWHAFGIDDANHAWFDPPNAPAVGAEGEDISGHRFGCPVFVDRADEGVIGVEEDSVIA